jgi:23S rRNA pseudouridine2605 synthase
VLLQFEEFKGIIMATERLQKILARAGITSRRKAEQLILEGRVAVNGKVVSQLGTKADSQTDHIKIDGKLLAARRVPRHYFIAFKPQRVITSLSDPHGRFTISDMLRSNKIRVRVFPVGRLDWDADGLLLLTNDGELANLVMHPRTHLSKVYRVKIRGCPSEKNLQHIQKGVMLDRGIRTLPAQVFIEQQKENTTWLRVTLVEGRQHQIKKMFAKIGHPVRHIRRIAIGPLRLKQLQVGEIRRLTDTELTRLKKTLRM